MSYDKNIKSLLQAKIDVDNATIDDINLSSGAVAIIRDKDYLKFVKKIGNGGFFFDRALQFYGFTETKGCQSLELVNETFLREYSELASGLITIGQDVFGNQFVYEQKSDLFYFFNIETADKENLGKGFRSFINKIFSDIEYYSGRSFIVNWTEKLKPGERLSPKKPFVVGGEYLDSNFYISPFPKYLEYFADIAKQLHKLSDGTPIKIKII